MGRVTSLILFLVVVLAVLGAVNGQPAQAATCADYANQAAAQHARDTRDADGDGIYCESLPCPCAKPGDAGERGRPASRPAGKLRPEWLRAPERRAEHLVQRDEVPQHPPALPRRLAQGLAADAGTQPLRRRRTP